MKNFSDFKNFVVKNKYVIIFIMISIALFLLGVLRLVSEFIVLVGLIVLSLYFGKKLQEDDSSLRSIFETKNYKKDENVYYYQDAEDKSKSEEKK